MPGARACAAGRDQRGEGVRDRRHPRGVPGRARRGRAPAFRGELVRRGMAGFVDDAKMSFMEHLGELRVRIVRSLTALLIGTVIIGSARFVVGGAFSLFVVTPYAIQFLLSYARPGLTPMITIQNHIDFLLKFTLAFGAVFELPLALTILARVGIVNAKMLAKN